MCNIFRKQTNEMSAALEHLYIIVYNIQPVPRNECQIFFTFLLFVIAHLLSLFLPLLYPCLDSFLCFSRALFCFDDATIAKTVAR